MSGAGMRIEPRPNDGAKGARPVPETSPTFKKKMMMKMINTLRTRNVEKTLTFIEQLNEYLISLHAYYPIYRLRNLILGRNQTTTTTQVISC